MFAEAEPSVEFDCCSSFAKRLLRESKCVSRKKQPREFEQHSQVSEQAEADLSTCCRRSSRASIFSRSHLSSMDTGSVIIHSESNTIAHDAFKSH